ncbi:ABC transporter permease [Saccharothrix coeruleofusca]|uniref:ABC transporter permease n=1 Tax=Saccharothrix coeruleofusca TaxID=33919 RepID=A0A918AT07_9PSEU|nr:ABC transporter permease [Saccharothrix coeruleofusca]MBP2336988.1 ABC-type transport system involved in multi-copper enzyme maturation permease subunit [Saccharothrix coeruleofusca]GGP84005.1 ABC transporter permease [Saccharothrix coeruleofusca]
MTDVIASEWLKLRSVRSTGYLLLALLLTLLAGSAVAYLMTADWDTSPPQQRARFGSADPSVMVVPFGQFLFGVLGALAVTSEYGSGMIRTALVSVPRRRTLLLAKTAVVGGGAVVLGLVVASAAALSGELITGDRPAPIAAFDSSAALWSAVLANAAALALLALLGLGLGFVLRSTAGTLVALCGLLFVLPVLVLMLPQPWDERLYALTPGVLAPQLTGAMADPSLTPWGAGLVMVAYAAVSLGAGAAVLLRRDA